MNHPPTELDEEVIPEILALLAEYGQDAEIVTVGESNFDYVSGVGSPETIRTPIKITPPTVVEIQTSKREVKGDKKFFFAGSGNPVPGLNSQFYVMNQLHAAIECSPIYSGNLVALWKILARRSS